MKIFIDIKQDFINTETGPMVEIESCLVIEILESRKELFKSKRYFSKEIIKHLYNHLDDMDMKLFNQKERWVTHD